MKKILIIGSGAMGAAFSIPLIENRHHVTLSEPHNIKLISKLNLKKKFHPSLKINLPKKIKTKKFVPEMLNLKWDLIVVAVSSVGIEIISEYLAHLKSCLLYTSPSPRD